MDTTMTDKKNALHNSPLPGFVHKTLANGIRVSTCLHCKKSLASPTSASLKMAEENHRCASPARKSK
jgi:hypothetical protein